MPFRCISCVLKFTSKKSLAKHLKRCHIKRRCTICFQKCFTLKRLYVHYIKSHSKELITKQLMKQYSQIPIRFLRWNRTRTNFDRDGYILNTSRIQKLYIKENIHISYGNKEIIVELSSDDEESLEISIGDVSSSNKKTSQLLEKNKPVLKALIYDDNSNCSLEFVKPNEKLVIVPKRVKCRKPVRKVGTALKSSKQYKHFCLELFKSDDTKSLDDTTGKFYVCNCSKKEESESEKEDEVIMVTSDTESSSDNGKYSFYPIVDKKFYCTICGNGYRTKNKLTEHYKIHNFHCHPCGTYYSTQKQYNDHIKSHVPIYCCHLCNHEFLQKISLSSHLNIHQEQEILKNILELEENYTHYLINFNSETYATSLNNISSFLTQTCDFKYNHTEFYKVKCHLCFMDFFKCDFQQHLKMHYYFRNSNSYFRSAEYSCM